MDILKTLNPKQREAVVMGKRPLLIIAGAGSGKTRVLTHRIAYLIKERGVSPHRILAVTFTNKAAGEMKERVKVLLGWDVQGLWMGTFHSICLRILRKELPLLGIDGYFTIYDERDQLSIIKECLAELRLDERFFSPKGVLSSISRAKDRSLKPGESLGEGDYYSENLSKIYSIYQERLKRNGAMDFGDMLLETLTLFQDHPMILKRYQGLFEEVLVDEFQDTNKVQYLLTKALTSIEKGNLWVVGDEDQSIYSWRGAEIRNIIDLEKDFPDIKVLRLEQNYRSTGMILKAANSLVEKNRDRLGKTLWTENREGERVIYQRFLNEHHEAVAVGSNLLSLVETGKKYRNIAIFYRTNAQSRVIEEEFLKLGIPYALIGGVKFYERMEIKDILAYLRFMINPNDSVSLRRIVNSPPRGIGKATREAISLFADEHDISFYEAMKRSLQKGILSKGRERDVKDFVSMIEGLKDSIKGFGLHDQIKTILDSTGYMRMWEDNIHEEGERMENIREFISAVKDFEERKSERGNLEEFLDMVALVTDIDLYEEGYDSVSLMTLHSAKGLEFPVVFILGLEERLFPHSRSFEDGTIEEERRLCYVGMTRAKEMLYLSGARERRVFGIIKLQEVSRFIDEIDPSYILQEDAEFYSDFTGFTEEENDTGGLWYVGEKVRHPTFGVGTIKAKEGEEKLTVLFHNVGLKKLLLSYTTLEKL